MSTIRLTWKVGDPPSGRYRSFQKREWPGAHYTGSATQLPAVSISCEDGYTPSAAKSGKHPELIVRVADHSQSKVPGCQGFKWRTLTNRFASLEAAKAAGLQVIIAHPEFQPEFQSTKDDHASKGT